MTGPLIYVVDDEAEVREVICECLGSRSYEVEAFADGAAALAAIGQRAPGLVLLDINMPGMTGWRVREALKADPATSSIPVIAITAQGGNAIETTALKTLEFAGFIRKPFRIKELAAGIEKALANKA